MNAESGARKSQNGEYAKRCTQLSLGVLLEKCVEWKRNDEQYEGKMLRKYMQLG